MVANDPRPSAIRKGNGRSEERDQAGGDPLGILAEMFPDEVDRVKDAFCDIYSRITTEMEGKGIRCVASVAKLVREYPAAGV